jgi:hypothetical protein
VVAALWIGGVAGYLFWQEKQQRTERRAAVERQQAAARPRICIEALAGRDPLPDVANDIARGDATPIGLTYRPREGAMTITFPGVDACNGARPPYRPTGKWLRETGSSWDLRQAREQPRCEAAVRRYVAAYNAEMLRLAPGPVRHYCQQETLHRR